MLPFTNREWISALRASIEQLPSDYIVLDVETSGLDIGADYVLQMAQLVVRDRKIVHQSKVLLDWVGNGLLDAWELQHRMQTTARQMEKAGRTYRVNYDDLCANGCDPRMVFDELRQTLAHAIEHGVGVVGHNYVRYDGPIISRHLLRFGHDPNATIVGGNVFDTGAIEKGRQLNLVPMYGEPMAVYASRVMDVRSRVKWKLDGHCADEYGLWARSGLSPADAHDALSDCHLTHCLFEGMRELLELT